MDIWGLISGSVGKFFDMARSLAAGIVGRIFATAGVGLASYNVLLPQVVDFVQQYLNGLPPGILEMMAALRLDQALTLIFSALAVKMGTKVKPIRIGGQDAAP